MKAIFKRFINFFTKWFKEYAIEVGAGYEYYIKIENPTVKEREAVVFGYNENRGTLNLGSDEKIKISAPCIDAGYTALVGQSASKPFKLGLLRLMAERYCNIPTVITYYTKDANGTEYWRNSYTGSDFSAYQQQSNIIDFKRLARCGIDGNSMLKIKMPPSSTLHMTVFPIETKILDYFEYKKFLDKKRSKGQIKVVTNITFFSYISDKIKKFLKLK